MKEFFDSLYDDQNEDEGEPSFSLYQFKEWLSKQKKHKHKNTEETHKDELKEKFKERFRAKVRKKRKKDEDA